MSFSDLQKQLNPSWASSALDPFLAAWLRHQARAFPDTVFVIYGTVSHTYGCAGLYLNALIGQMYE